MSDTTSSAATAKSTERSERRAQASLEELQKRTLTVVTANTKALEELLPRIVGIEPEQAAAIRKVVADLRTLVPARS